MQANRKIVQPKVKAENKTKNPKKLKIK